MKIILFTNARDEKYIKEWAIHHLLLGFDKIIIFDHKSIIPLSKVFHQFDKRISIVNVSKMENPVKLRLMNMAIKIGRVMRATWILYLDADEFVVLNPRFIHIKAMMHKCWGIDSLAINWVCFGSNFLKKDPDEGTLLESYTKCSGKLEPLYKSIIRPFQAINATNPHFFNMRVQNRCIGTNGQRIPANTPENTIHSPYSSAPIYIAHFLNQSEETYIRRKVKLPTDDTGTYRVDPLTENVEYIHEQFNNEENTFLKNNYANKIKEFLQSKNIY